MVMSSWMKILSQSWILLFIWQASTRLHRPDCMVGNLPVDKVGFLWGGDLYIVDSLSKCTPWKVIAECNLVLRIEHALHYCMINLAWCCSWRMGNASNMLILPPPIWKPFVKWWIEVANTRRVSLGQRPPLTTTISVNLCPITKNYF